MNTHIHNETICKNVTYPETTLSPTDLLAQWGFTWEEITLLVFLWQWYQIGDDDRASVVRHLKFLRLLVRSGDLEL